MSGWFTLRVLVGGAAASLAFYIPFKYATQLHAIEGLYAVLFPLSGVLALLGLAFAARPVLAFRLPGLARASVAALAAGWIATGLLCIPSLTAQTLATPLGGLFATFHMLAQHVFLSMTVAVLAVAPAAAFAQFGVPLPEPSRPVRRVPAPTRV